MASPLLPVPRPLLLCEEVLYDSPRGLFHTVGVFNALRSSANPPFPYQHSSLCVFAQLSDCQGQVPSRIDIVEAATLEPIFQSSTHSLVFRSRSSVVNAVFRIHNCSFPRPGVYWVQLYCHGVFLVDQVLHLLEPRE
jgi:hypothetical protein